MDFLFSTTGAIPAADASVTNPRVWKLSEFSAVRLVPREPNAPANQHPAQVNPERLRADLAALEISTRSGRSVPLFVADELGALVPTLVRALAAANPADDVLLLSTSRREDGILSMPLSATGRLFVQDDALQFIVHDARLDVYNTFRAGRIVPALEYGSRSSDSGVTLRSASAVPRRGDWVALSLAAGTRGASEATATDPPRPAPPATPNEAAPAGRTRDATFYAEQEQRLRSLKRLRDQDLISESEYQQKRREILQGL